LALLADTHRGSRLIVSAKNEAATRYDRPAFSREVFMATVAEMEAHGLLLRERGSRGRQRTTIAPTGTFLQRLEGLDIRIGRKAPVDSAHDGCHLEVKKPPRLSVDMQPSLRQRCIRIRPMECFQRRRQVIPEDRPQAGILGEKAESEGRLPLPPRLQILPEVPPKVSPSLRLHSVQHRLDSGVTVITGLGERRGPWSFKGVFLMGGEERLGMFRRERHLLLVG
jgi:hypothetical protein